VDAAWGIPSDIWAAISESNLLLLAASALVATAVFLLRAIRWRIILGPAAPDMPIAPLWRAIAVGMMVNNIYPARLGEIARAYALRRETDRVSLTSAVASLAVDRVFDALTLMLLLVGAMLAPDFPRGMTVAGQPVERGAVLLAAGTLGLFVCSMLSSRFRASSFAFTLASSAASRRDSWSAEHNHQRLSEGLGEAAQPAPIVSVFLWA
jgi:uncharacterized protein (TIRG00374 family)